VGKQQALQEMATTVQHAATSKAAAAVGVGTATTPAWVEWVVSSPESQAMIILIGVCVSLSIVGVNLQAIWIRHKKNSSK